MINAILLLYVFSGIGYLFFKLINLNSPQTNWQKVLGESFFMGVFFIICINNLSQLLAIEIPQNLLFNAVLVISTLSFASLIISTIKNNGLTFGSKPSKPNVWVVVVYIVLMAHLYFIVIQNQQLPLTPWDAWNSWVAKAKIWFYHGLNQDLVNRFSWLITKNTFTNATAHYPDGLPLLYLFNSGFFGWNETTLNAVYPAMFIAFLCAFYGNISLLINKTYALVAVVLIITIPLINVHVTLGGYADIWVSTFLVLVLFNLQHFLSHPSVKQFIVIACFVGALLMFKLIAWVWISIAALTFALCLLEQHKRKWLYLIISVVFLLWLIIGGLSFDTPFGQVIIKPNLIVIPALGSYKLAFLNTTSSWIEALFLSKNWNLLWYSIPVVIILYLRTNKKNSSALPAIFMLFSTLFLFVLFYMTHNSVFANDFTSSNRVVLHIVPVYIYLSLQVFYQYQLQKASVSTNSLAGNVGKVF